MTPALRAQYGAPRRGAPAVLNQWLVRPVWLVRLVRLVVTGHAHSAVPRHFGSIFPPFSVFVFGMPFFRPFWDFWRPRGSPLAPFGHFGCILGSFLFQAARCKWLQFLFGCLSDDFESDVFHFGSFFVDFGNILLPFSMFWLHVGARWFHLGVFLLLRGSSGTLGGPRGPNPLYFCWFSMVF